MATLSNQETVDKLMNLWEEFRCLIPTYRKILERMKEIKKKETSCKSRKKLVLDKIPETFLREEYPRTSFLNLSTKEEAAAYLDGCNPSELLSLLKCIERDKESVFYMRLTRWIASSEGRIKGFGRPTGYHYDQAAEYERKKKMAEIANGIF